MMDSKECVSAVMIGAGNRGKDVYGQYALDYPHELRFIAIAEPHPVRRNLFAQAHSIPSSHQYNTWEDLLRSKILKVIPDGEFKQGNS